jgi:hypothetical protein
MMQVRAKKDFKEHLAYVGIANMTTTISPPARHRSPRHRPGFSIASKDTPRHRVGGKQRIT